MWFLLELILNSEALRAAGEPGDWETNAKGCRIPHGICVVQPAVWWEERLSAFSVPSSLVFTTLLWVTHCISGAVESCEPLISGSCPSLRRPLPHTRKVTVYTLWVVLLGIVFPSAPEADLLVPPWTQHIVKHEDQLVITWSFLSRRRTDFLFSRWLSQASQRRQCWPSASCCLFKLVSHSARLAKPSAPAVYLGCHAGLAPCHTRHSRAGAMQKSVFNTHEVRKLPSKPMSASLPAGWHKKMPALGLPLDSGASTDLIWD